MIIGIKTQKETLDEAEKSPSHYIADKDKEISPILFLPEEELIAEFDWKSIQLDKIPNINIADFKNIENGSSNSNPNQIPLKQQPSFANTNSRI